MLPDGTTIMRGPSGCFLPGTSTAIMGASGAGKTTIMNLRAPASSNLARKSTGDEESKLPLLILKTVKPRAHPESLCCNTFEPRPRRTRFESLRKEQVTRRIRRVTGKVKKTSGVIKVNDEECASLAKWSSRVAFVPQEDIMHRQLTVLENLEFSAMTRLPATWTLARGGVASLLRWRSRNPGGSFGQPGAASWVLERWDSVRSGSPVPRAGFSRGGIQFVRAARRRELGSHGAGNRCALLGAPSASPPGPRSRRRAARTDGPDKI